jgi:hypothetical protein
MSAIGKRGAAEPIAAPTKRSSRTIAPSSPRKQTSDEIEAQALSDFDRSGQVPWWLRLSGLPLIPVIICSDSIAAKFGVSPVMPSLAASLWVLIAFGLITWYKNRPGPTAGKIISGITFSIVAGLAVAIIGLISLLAAIRVVGLHNQSVSIPLALIPTIAAAVYLGRWRERSKR